MSQSPGQSEPGIVTRYEFPRLEREWLPFSTQWCTVPKLRMDPRLRGDDLFKNRRNIHEVGAL